MTGHKGLIGSFLLDKFEKRGDNAVLLVDKRDGRDIVSIDEIGFEGNADVLIHLASFCKINKTIEDPYLAFENNVIGIMKVMDFCRRNKIPKIVFTSSSRILEEEKNPYTASKIYGEELIKAYSQCYGIDYVIVRPSTVYGPFNDKSQRLIDVFILNALQGKELKIFGDENKNLDFTYVNDFIDGFLIALEEKNREFDLSYGSGIKVSDVADMIIKLAGNGVKVFYEKEIAQPQQVELDISAIRELGYEPKIGIEEGLKRTFHWYRENFEEILSSRSLR
jgi:nucleoside-diphosphate-sugar epimerase